jgi:hypothetical protein
MKIYSVNEAVDNIELLNGSSIYIEGILSFEFENVSIYHSKSSERKDRGYLSSIWLEVAKNLTFDSAVMEKWSTRKVLVEGTLVKPDPNFGGGHMGLWPAEFIATDIKIF